MTRLGVPILFSLSVVFLPLVVAANASEACDKIADQLSDASGVARAYNIFSNFREETSHWFQSSSQRPECVVTVGSTEDVSTTMEIISSMNASFAIYAGGHASNQGFSSTDGVHITLNRMNGVEVLPESGTAKIGTGNTWAEVYEKLDGSGVNVVGGRVPGPAVGGLTLGGGFSWKTNQFGLGVDTIKSMELVMPNGTVTMVDASTPDLFFALKGGLNRFGVVTMIEFETHEQADEVYGGVSFYIGDAVDKVLNATAQFDAENEDPRAQIITTVFGLPLGSAVLALFFYDGGEPPESFAPFDDITPVFTTVKSQSFLSCLENDMVMAENPGDFSEYVMGIPAQVTSLINIRGGFHTTSTTKITEKFVMAVKDEAEKMGKEQLAHGGTIINYDIEPFLHTYGSVATDSAYPHADSPLPLNLYFGWSNAAEDNFWYDAMRSSVERLEEIAREEGIAGNGFTKYPNYALFGTGAAELYGEANAERLRQIRSRVDPDRIMDMTGGFEI